MFQNEGEVCGYRKRELKTSGRAILLERKCAPVKK